MPLPANELLPAVLNDIQSAVGPLVMRQICKAFGGTTIYIPENPRAGSKLARLVGLEAAQKIARKLSAGQVTIPLGPNASEAQIRRAIRAKLEAGHSEAATALALGCHERTVRRERARMRKEPGPLLRLMEGTPSKNPLAPHNGR
jgi:hypothetical protein